MSNNQPSLLDSEEEALEHLRTKLGHLTQCAQVDMCQKLVQILPLSKTSPDGPCPKLADQIMMLRNLTEIRPTTPDHPLVNNAIQKIHQLGKHILVQLEGMVPQDLVLSKTRCRVDKV